RVVCRNPGEFEGEVGFHGSREVAWASVVDAPEPFFGLLRKEVIDDLTFTLRIDYPEQMKEHQILGSYRHIGFELGPPVTFRELLPQKEILAAPDCLVKGRAGILFGTAATCKREIVDLLACSGLGRKVRIFGKGCESGGD